MFRSALLLVAAAAACGGVDDRPKNLRYITEAILAPSCGAAECHSQYTQQVGDEYDTVDAARASMVHNQQVIIPADQTSASRTYLVGALTTGQSSQSVPPTLGSNGLPAVIRMPYDAPLPNEDIQLLIDWIALQTDANGPPGAQCVPQDNGGKWCAATDKNIHECTPDGDVGVFVQGCGTKTCCSGAHNFGSCCVNDACMLPNGMSECQ